MTLIYTANNVCPPHFIAGPEFQPVQSPSLTQISNYIAYRKRVITAKEESAKVES